MPIISSTSLPIRDSAGFPSNGRVFFEQSARYVTPSGLITTTRGAAKVTNGVIRTTSGGALEIPATPEGQVVWFFEDFQGGTGTVKWAVVIPDVAEIGYAELSEMAVVEPATGNGVPAWVSQVLTAVEDAEAAQAAAEAAAEAAAAHGGTSAALDPVDDAILLLPLLAYPTDPSDSSILVLPIGA